MKRFPIGESLFDEIVRGIADEMARCIPCTDTFLISRIWVCRVSREWERELSVRVGSAFVFGGVLFGIFGFFLGRVF